MQKRRTPFGLSRDAALGYYKALIFGGYLILAIFAVKADSA